MKLFESCLTAAVIFTAFSTKAADETFQTLKAGDEVYSNVTVTSVSATDIYFTHSTGIGNAKLKSLNPELQMHFHFDAAKAVATEKKRTEETVEYRKEILSVKPKKSE